MPDVGGAERAVIEAYQRCKRWGALPAAGGLMDQPEWIMQLLDSVDERVEYWQHKQSDDDATGAKKAEMEEALNGRGNRV